MLCELPTICVGDVAVNKTLHTLHIYAIILLFKLIFNVFINPLYVS